VVKCAGEEEHKGGWQGKGRRGGWWKEREKRDRGGVGGQ